MFPVLDNVVVICAPADKLALFLDEYDRYILGLKVPHCAVWLAAEGYMFGLGGYT